MGKEVVKFILDTGSKKHYIAKHLVDEKET